MQLAEAQVLDLRLVMQDFLVFDSYRVRSFRVFFVSALASTEFYVSSVGVQYLRDLLLDLKDPEIYCKCM